MVEGQGGQEAFRYVYQSVTDVFKIFFGVGPFRGPSISQVRVTPSFNLVPGEFHKTSDDRTDVFVESRYHLPHGDGAPLKFIVVLSNYFGNDK